MTEHGQTEFPDRAREIETIGLYTPKESKIWLSAGYADQVLDQRSREQVKKAFKKVGKPDKFLNWCCVAILAEEFAHFVQHTRGELPNFEDVPATFVFSVKPHVASDVGSLEDDVIPTMRKVFDLMGYTGYPPKEILISSEIVQLMVPENLSTNEENYYDNVELGTHIRQYDFELRANDIQTETLKWWCLEKEQLPFWYAISHK